MLLAITSVEDYLGKTAEVVVLLVNSSVDQFATLKKNSTIKTAASVLCFSLWLCILTHGQHRWHKKEDSFTYWLHKREEMIDWEKKGNNDTPLLWHESCPDSLHHTELVRGGEIIKRGCLSGCWMTWHYFWFFVTRQSKCQVIIL